jgi:hypothetical protein
MRLWLALVLMVPSCVSPNKPTPTAINKGPPLPVRAAPLKTVPQIRFRAATAQDPTLVGVWVYPTVIPTNSVWDLQGSSNLTTWVTEQTNLGPGDVFIRFTNKFRFYRMRAR